MTYSTLFDIANSIATFAWAFMLFTPNWKYTRFLVTRMTVPALLALIYAALIFSDFSITTVDFSSLTGVKNLFGNDLFVLAGWIHYLSFDLLVGSWILSISQRDQIAHWIIIVPLIFTFLAGPAGWLLFLVIYIFVRRQWPELRPV